jgi:hypothetical protein
MELIAESMWVLNSHCLCEVTASFMYEAGQTQRTCHVHYAKIILPVETEKT